METFVFPVLSFLILLLIAGGTHLLSKKLRISYTILLVIVGIILVPIMNIPGLAFMKSFSLTPDLLFYIFLPILLFESAYNIKYRDITKDNLTIRTLAVGGLLLSTAIIGVLGYFLLNTVLGFPIPFMVVLLFGAIVSATDPVAVLALFKEFGAPKRLTLLFEGESLFNDGTGLAVFLIVYEIAQAGSFHTSTVLIGIGQFLTMIFGGIILGLFLGFLFANGLKRIQNNEPVEIILTMLLAHITFLSADLIGHYLHIGAFEVKISGVIATTFAALVMGNYGRTKISPKVEETMEKFWGFFAFVSNSLVFLLLGVMVSHVTIPYQQLIIPLCILIGVTVLARAISVYLPIGFLNYFRLIRPIPLDWQHLLARGSLRGALAFMMVLLMSDTFSVAGWEFPYTIKEFLIVAVIAKILFTLFVKGTTIAPLLKYWKIGEMNMYEKFLEMFSIKTIIHFTLDKIEHMKANYHMENAEYDTLKDLYTGKLQQIQHNIDQLLLNNKDDADTLMSTALLLQALGIEKNYIKKLFSKHELSERLYLHLLYKIETQIERVESGKPPLKTMDEKTTQYDFFTTIHMRLFPVRDSVVDEYIKNRTKEIITHKVLHYLNSLEKDSYGYTQEQIDTVKSLYQQFHDTATQKANALYEAHTQKIQKATVGLFGKGLVFQEDHLIDELYEKHFLTAKSHTHLLQMNDTIIHSDLNAVYHQLEKIRYR